MVRAELKSFKHDGSSHRLWSIIDLVKEDDDFYYCAAIRAKVIESDGREWRAPEGALYILSKKHFYNVIVMFISDVLIEYYVNIASPIIRPEPSSFEFIDYDLDLKRDELGLIRELDWNEYHGNSATYKYSPQLMEVIESTFKEVKDQMSKGIHPFDDARNRKMFDTYKAELKAKNVSC